MATAIRPSVMWNQNRCQEIKIWRTTSFVVRYQSQPGSIWLMEHRLDDEIERCLQLHVTFETQDTQ
jgi:hypothetical protein